MRDREGNGEDLADVCGCVLVGSRRRKVGAVVNWWKRLLGHREESLNEYVHRLFVKYGGLEIRYDPLRQMWYVWLADDTMGMALSYENEDLFVALGTLDSEFEAGRREAAERQAAK